MNTQTNSKTQRYLELWQSFSQNKASLLGLFVLMVFLILAIFGKWIAPYDAVSQFREFLMIPPVWQEGGSWQFILGTDAVGRDILSRLIHGTRYSFSIGLVVITISLIIGIFLGLISGYFGGRIDTLIMRIMDVILSFPSILLALVVVAILGPGLRNAIIAIAFVYLPHFVRLARGQVMNEKAKDYLASAVVLGAGRSRQMFLHILPNCMPPLIVQATLSFSSVILDAAALGFLGIGAQAPTPEWGTMLSDAREFILRAWWIVTFPGIMILIAVLAINLVGDGLRDALDPRRRKRKA